jgi:elongation factor Ts
VSREDVPDDFLESERKIIAGSDELARKPENIRDKIVEGKLASVLSDKGGVLLEQVYIKDEAGKRKVADVVAEVAAAMKENLVVRRFARFRVGEED